jgi:hypothetical protein
VDTVKYKPIGSYPISKDYHMVNLVFYGTAYKVPHYKNIIGYIK